MKFNGGLHGIISIDSVAFFSAQAAVAPKSGHQMKALRQKLQKQAVTRQWVGLDSDKQAVSQDEQEPLGTW